MYIVARDCNELELAHTLNLLVCITLADWFLIDICAEWPLPSFTSSSLRERSLG
jgi:hypothetical protein